MSKDSSIYFDIHKTLDYGCFLNFLIGGRGCGKTYATSKFCIEDYLKRGRQFLYVRRSQADIDDSLPKFFDDLIKNDAFPDHELKVGKDGTLMIDGEICGYSQALSTAGNKKSIPYPNVFNIIYEEFLRDTGSGYLKNECHKLLELLSTVLRLRNGRVFLIANAMSTTNPYFSYFGIEPGGEGEIKVFKQGSILINRIQNTEAFNKKWDDSPIGKLTAGTKYEKYAKNNEFILDSKTFVEKKSGQCKHWFNIKIDDHIMGFWYNKERHLYLSDDIIPDATLLVLNIDDHDESSLFMKRNNGFFKAIESYYRESRLYFESINIKNEFMREFTKLLTY